MFLCVIKSNNLKLYLIINITIKIKLNNLNEIDNVIVLVTVITFVNGIIFS